MKNSDPKFNVMFNIKSTLLDTNNVWLTITWDCPECGEQVTRHTRAVIWVDPTDRSSSMETCMFREWECDQCLSPEAKHRRLLMRKFNLDQAW